MWQNMHNRCLLRATSGATALTPRLVRSADVLTEGRGPLIAAGFGSTRAASMRSSPKPAPSCSPKGRLHANYLKPVGVVVECVMSSPSIVTRAPDLVS
jgi:hypothetical protein